MFELVGRLVIGGVVLLLAVSVASKAFEVAEDYKKKADTLLSEHNQMKDIVLASK